MEEKDTHYKYTDQDIIEDMLKEYLEENQEILESMPQDMQQDVIEKKQEAIKEIVRLTRHLNSEDKGGQESSGDTQIDSIVDMNTIYWLIEDIGWQEEDLLPDEESDPKKRKQLEEKCEYLRKLSMAYARIESECFLIRKLEKLRRAQLELEE